MNGNPVVSVIITTKNEESIIERLIESIRKQTYADKEIILVDNSSKDRTLELAKKMGGKGYTYGPERSSQRNFGAKQAKGR